VAALPWLVGGILALALGALTVIALVPSLRFAYHAPELRAGIETAAAIVPLFAASLVVGRFKLSGSMRDLALIGALGTLALTNLTFVMIPALAGAVPGRFTTWTTPVGGLFSALAMAAAALQPDIRLPRPARSAYRSVAVVIAAVGAIALGVGLLDEALPSRFGTHLTVADSEGLRLGGPAGFVVLQSAAALMFALAAVGFAVRARADREDELTGWLALAAAAAAGARLHSLAFPTVNLHLVLTADVLRLVFVSLLLAGGLREIRSYQRRLELAAIMDERRRVARDLHDGLAQELAFIAVHSQRLLRTGDEPLRMLATAAERALEESRLAIRTLSRRADDPFDSEVAQLAEHLATRAGARVRLDLDSRARLPAEPRNELLRILREAMTNGLRHGGATEMAVELAAEPGVRLRVRDNGKGFDPRKPGHGFGLTSMRERADALGGRLRVHSRPGEGTEVEVLLP
jgi:signal transduction histidine kinase